MELSSAVRIRINDLLKERKWNISKLSTFAGISRSTLSKFMSGQRKYIRLDILEYICEAFDIKLVDFFDDKVFDDINVQD